MACLIEAVYLLELERQERRDAAAVAQQWWKPFRYRLAHELVDERDGSVFGAIFERDHQPAAAVDGEAPRAVIAFRGTLLRGPTIRRDVEDELLPAGAQQPPRLGAARRRAPGAQGDHREVRVGERLPLRPLPRRRLRPPGRQDARLLLLAAVAAPPPPRRRGVARVPPLQRALPVAAHGRQERRQDGRLPAQGGAHRRRRRRPVARQGAQERGLRQLHPRLHEAREQQEVVREIDHEDDDE